MGAGGLCDRRGAAAATVIAAVVERSALAAKASHQKVLVGCVDRAVIVHVPVHPAGQATVEASGEVGEVCAVDGAAEVGVAGVGVPEEERGGVDGAEEARAGVGRGVDLGGGRRRQIVIAALEVADDHGRLGIGQHPAQLPEPLGPTVGERRSGVEDFQVSSSGELVQGAGYRQFAGAGFTGDQHRGAGPGGSMGFGAEGRPRLRLADQPG